MSHSKSNKQASIDYLLRKTYEQIDIDRDPICTGCGSGSKPLSHSHTISRQRCKQIGKPELIHAPENIELECFGTSTSCHDVWEHEGITKRMQLNNFDSKMRYIEQHDTEKFASMTLAIKSVTTGLSG